LSEGRDGESRGGNVEKRPDTRPADKKKNRQRTSDVGRALRTVYDDTLREAVPDDFLSLLGKLS
jgi:hypothetical protein